MLGGWDLRKKPLVTTKFLAMIAIDVAVALFLVVETWEN